MPLTNFVDGTTKIVASWLNQIDVFVNTLFNGATTAAQARTALGVSATGADTTYAARASNLSDLADVNAARGTLSAAKSGANTDITSLNAPALGAATATTQTGTDNTTKVATTAMVQAALATITTSTTVPVRQTVLYGALSGGAANHLSAGAGLNYNISATSTPLVVTYANGNSDSTATISANASNQGSLTANTTNFLHSTYVSTSSVTWSNSIVPPQYGYTFDQAQNALLNFEGTNGATTTTDDFGNAWTLTGATISTAQFKFGASSLSLSGTSQYARTTSITSMGGDSWEASIWFRLTALPTSGNLMEIMGNRDGAPTSGWGLYLFNSAGVTKLQLYAMNASAWDIANGTVGINTTWTLNQWNRVRVVFDAVGGTYRAYLSLNGATETQDISVTSSLRVSNPGAFSIGGNLGVGVGSQFNGYMDAFRFMRASSGNATTTPSASAPAIGDYPVHWFSIPEMKMYEATTASSTSGTNPTFTQRNRTFHGEADTGASTVSAVRNYAYQGRYVSALTAVPAASTRTTFSHNIGVDPQFLKSKGWIRFVTTWNSYTAGMVVPYTSYYQGTNPPPLDYNVIESRLIASLLNNANGIQIPMPLTGPTSYQPLPTGSGTAQLYVAVERGW